MNVYIVGNPLIPKDSLPVRLMPGIQKKFPTVTFQPVDPNENFMPEEGSIIIDSVDGIRNVTEFHDIGVFLTTKSVSPHDYDLGFHLAFLSKVHKLPSLTIVGVPMGIDGSVALAELKQILRKLFDKRKNKS